MREQYRVTYVNTRTESARTISLDTSLGFIGAANVAVAREKDGELIREIRREEPDPILSPEESVSEATLDYLRQHSERTILLSLESLIRFVDILKEKGAKKERYELINLISDAESDAYWKVRR